MILIVDFDLEKNDAMPAGGKECGYGGREADFIQPDSAWGRLSEDGCEKGDIGPLLELGGSDDVYPILRVSEENLAPLVAYVGEPEAPGPCEGMAGQREDVGKDFRRER